MGVQTLELHPRRRVEGHEPLHVPAHVVEPDGVDRGDPHRAIDARLDDRHVRLGLLPRLEDGAARRVEGLALGRDDERALGAVDQGHPELGLELLHPLARGRLGDEVLLGPSGERAEPGHVAIEAEGLDVHGSIIL